MTWVYLFEDRKPSIKTAILKLWRNRIEEAYGILPNSANWICQAETTFLITSSILPNVAIWICKATFNL